METENIRFEFWVVRLFFGENGSFKGFLRKFKESLAFTVESSINYWNR